MNNDIKVPLSTYILYFFTFAIFGWIYEVVLVLFQLGYFANRGALLGPWLPLYGYGGLAIIILTKKIRDKKWLVFLTSVFTAGVLEYTTALYLETFVKKKYWDYSNFYFNIHGRTCLEALIVFGIIAMILIYAIVPFLRKHFEKIPKKKKHIICIILLVLFGIDKINSYINPNTGDGIATDIKL